MKKNQLFFVIFSLMVFCGCFVFFVVKANAVAPYISINYNNSETKARKVQLNIQGPTDAFRMLVSNSADFTDAKWEPYQTQKTWYLDYGAGTKTVYIKFEDHNLRESVIYKDTIQLSVPSNMSVDFKINDGATETNSRYVSLKFSYSSGVEGYIVSNNNDFVGVQYSNMVDSLVWVLSPGDGVKTIYVQFIDANKKVTTLNKTISYRQLGASIPEGSLIKGQTNTIYYYGYDGELHPFLNSLIYHSWYKDFSNIKYVSNIKLSQYKLGNPVCVRPGTWMIKFKGLPKVYAVAPGCTLYPMLSSAEAYIIYGKNWQKRIIEIDPLAQNGYTALTYDATDAEAGIVDQDRDGVSADVEKDYGTSDSNSDSDNDGLTDYEEIYYWFTDPTVADTDHDGFKDGAEIVNGYNPAGAGQLDKIPENSYEYPAGSIIKVKKDGKLYYRNSNGKYYNAGKNSDDNLFKSNKLSPVFIIDSPYNIGFSVERFSINKSEMEILYPTQYVGSGLYQM